MCCYRRRRLGRWSQEEVEVLITKMEAGRVWAQIRDEWPKLGFPSRSDVDLKDKWRNLEDVVLQGKPTRTVKLSEEQMARIHRCHRKYRLMQASVSPGHLESPQKGQAGPSDHESAPQQQPDSLHAQKAADQTNKSSDSYRPTMQQGSSADTGSAAYQPGRDQHPPERSPMTTRSKARQG